MGAWSKFWEVSPNAASLFTQGMSKSACYSALGALDLDSAATLDDDDALRFWDWAFHDSPDFIGKIVNGSFRSAPNTYDDPSVTFIDADLTSSIAKDMTSYSRDRILDLLARPDGPNNPRLIWFLDPLKEFFCVAASRHNAVILLSERGDRLLTVLKD
jgi:hypothetical protein